MRVDAAALYVVCVILVGALVAAYAYGSDCAPIWMEWLILRC